MNRCTILIATLIVSCGGAAAADLDVLAPTPIQQVVPAGPRWEGFTAGINGGGLWSPSQAESQIWFPPAFPTTGLPTSFSFSPRGEMAGFQFGFNKQYGSFVVGGIADYDFVFGSKAKAAGSGVYTGQTPPFAPLPFTTAQSQQLQSLSTIRGRLGFTPIDDVLLYATAGLAFGATKTSTNVTFDDGAVFSGARDDTAVGWAAGGGVEYALGPQWSVGAEFLYYDLGQVHTAGTANFLNADGSGTPKTDSTFEFKGYTLRLGLNYEFDGPSDPSAAVASQDPAADVVGTFGVRAGMATGNSQMKLYDFTGATKVSELTYHSPTAETGEIFGRLDETADGLFLKGFAAYGKESGGHLQDEDFPPNLIPYSSTNSSQSGGHINYATIDAGYYPLLGPWYKLGGFAGFNYVSQTFNAFGCTQTAGNPDVCPAGEVGASNLTITDVGAWRSLRLGVAGEMKLPAGFSFRGEAAWLAYSAFAGGNDHWLREPEDFSGTIPENGTGSSGFQLEAELNYALSPNFDIGFGGRYWSMSAKGHVLFQDVSSTGGSQVATFRSQLAQAFIQTAYHF